MKQSIEERLQQGAVAASADVVGIEHSRQAILHRDNLIKMMGQLAGRRSRWDVFRDFVTMAAAALSKLDPSQADRREEEYLRSIRTYDQAEAHMFPKMFAELTLAMEAAPRDVLGEAFMLLELGNARAGQFFTPYSVCQMIAEMTFAQVTPQMVEQRGFITVQEPACGGGAMVIAAVEHLRSKGINYQQTVHVTATDLDPIAARMTFVQLALLHVPAIVVNGNTLTLEEFDFWRTPAHILGHWEHRLNEREQQANEDAPDDAMRPERP